MLWKSFLCGIKYGIASVLIYFVMHLCPLIMNDWKFGDFYFIGAAVAFVFTTVLITIFERKRLKDKEKQLVQDQNREV